MKTVPQKGGGRRREGGKEEEEVVRKQEGSECGCELDMSHVRRGGEFLPVLGKDKDKDSYTVV